MDIRTRDNGFSLIELMTGMAITLVVVAGALTTFKDALSINDAGQAIADSSQNLRSGSNLLVRDLMQAGRQIPIGGIQIPNGPGATPLNRPSPPGGPVFTFNNTTQSMLMTVTTGKGLGPIINMSSTDMVTFLMIDPLIGDTSVCDATPPIPPATVPNNTALLQNDSSYLTVAGTTSNTTFNWLTGDPVNGVSPVKAGDIIFFNIGQGALRTVTNTDASKIYFGTNDWFNFNQAAATQGTLPSLRTGSGGTFPCGSASRLLMYTYYVDATTIPGTPRLTRVINHFPPQVLAGVVEDLDIAYDLVDGTVNPTLVSDLPYTLGGLTYNATQIRKVNLHIGVRSDAISSQTHDYMRTHLSTVISLRNLAFVPVYQ